jgi:hypothetical protein
MFPDGVQQTVGESPYEFSPHTSTHLLSGLREFEYLPNGAFHLFEECCSQAGTHMFIILGRVVQFLLGKEMK